jgi:hypothetical protein
VQIERLKIRKKLKNPNVGLRVTKRPSVDGNSLYVLITASQHRLEEQAEQIGLKMKLKVGY